ncbi:hypothetical protein ACLMJK_007546 [Lecanora helva]
MALPPELRLLIYEELLHPEPYKVHTLYHDKEGRVGPFNFHLAILQVSRRVHQEASPMFYGENVFEIVLANIDDSHHMYCPGRPHPISLFRSEQDRDGRMSLQHILNPPRDEIRPVFIHRNCFPLDTFRRLRQVKVVAGDSSFWERHSTDGYRLSSTGHIIMEILTAWAHNDQEWPPKSRRLEFEVRPNRRTPYWIRRDPRDALTQRTMDERVKEIGSLLEVVKSSTTIICRRTRLWTNLVQLFGEYHQKEINEIDLNELLRDLSSSWIETSY